MKTGRPKLPSSAKKAQILGVRLLSHEKALIEAAAKEQGLQTLRVGKKCIAWQRGTCFEKSSVTACDKHA